MTTTAQQIEGLERELARLDALLMTEPSWVAMTQVDNRAARGELAAEDAAALRAGLEATLAGNAVYQARRRIAEAVDLLRSSGSVQPLGSPRPARSSRPSLVDRIAMIEPLQPGDVFRTRVSVKPAGPMAKPAPTVAATAASPAPPPRALGGDDLTRIRGIDGETAARLTAAGVTSYAAMAQWRAGDVRALAKALGLGKRIWREGWIEQAAILAAGKSTAFSSARAPCDVVSPAREPGVVMASADGGPSPLPVSESQPHPAPAVIGMPPVAFTPAPQPALPAGEGQAKASPPPAAPVGIDPRLLEMFERKPSQSGPRSLQAAVLAAEAAARGSPAGTAMEHAIRPAAQDAASSRPAGSAAAAPSSSWPAHSSPPTRAAAAAPAAPRPSARPEPPAPPAPYRAPVTEFGKSPQTEADLGEIVRELRASSRSRGEGGHGPEALDAEDGDAWLEPYREEASVEIIPMAPLAMPDNRRPEEMPRPLPVKQRPAPGSAPRVQYEGESHEAYLGMPMEASVDIVHFDEEGRRLPKSGPKPG